MILCAAEFPVEIVGVTDASPADGFFFGLPVVRRLEDLGIVDAVIITDLTDPQGRFLDLADRFPAERILAPGILGIARDAPKPRRKDTA